MKNLLPCLLLLMSASGLAQSVAPPTFRFSQQAGGTAADEGRAVVTDAAGNAVVAGIFRGTASFGSGTAAVQLTGTPPTSGTTPTAEAFVARYDAAGNLQWAQRAGGPGNDEALGAAIDPQGNVFVVGSFNGSASFGTGAAPVTLASAGADDVFLTKYNPAGALLWARRLGSADVGAENGYAVAADSAGNAVITGDFRGTASISGSTTTLSSAGGSDVFVAKFDPAGNLLWARSGSGTGIVDAGRAVAIDRRGAVLVTGSFRERVTFGNGSGGPAPLVLRARAAADLFVVKYDAAGTVQWGRLGTGRTTEIGRGIATDRLHNVYLFTSFRDTAYFTSDRNDSVRVTTAGGGDDLVLVKYDPLGRVQWLRSDGGAGSDESIAVTTDAQNNVYALSYFQGQAQYGPPATGRTFTSAGTSDIAVASYAPGGNFRWAERMGGPGTDAGYGVVISPTGNLWLTGYFTAGPFTAGTPGLFPLFTQPSNVRDVFVASTQMVPLAARSARTSQAALLLYPNPAAQQVFVRPLSISSTATLTLLDALGRVVRTAPLPAAGLMLPLQGLVPGRYTVRVQASNGYVATEALAVLP